MLESPSILYGVLTPCKGWRVGPCRHVQELGVGGGRGAGDDDLLLVAGLAGDLAAPLKLTVAGGDNIHHLLLHVEPTGVAEVGALPDLLGLVLAVRVHLTGFAKDSLVAKLCI